MKLQQFKITYQVGRKIMLLDDINFPTVKYGTKNKDDYKELTEAEWSPFFGYHYWEVFIFSMSYAYAKGLVPKSVPGVGNMPPNVFQQPTRDLMRSLAIDHTKDLNILKDTNAYVKICEEFAYAGFDEVLKRIKDNPSEVPVEDILINMIKEVHSEQN